MMSRYEIARNDTSQKFKRKKNLKSLIKKESVSKNDFIPKKEKLKIIIDQPHVVREIRRTGNNNIRAYDIDGESTGMRARSLCISGPGGYRIYIPTRSLNARLIETDRGLEFAVRLPHNEAESLISDINGQIPNHNQS